jgi:chromosome segregation ATPase
MVDSAHDSVAQLKAQLSEAAADADDARAAAEATERQLLKLQEASSDEAAALRSELDAARGAAAKAEEALAAAREALREEQARARAAKDAAAEKDAMIR